MDKDLLTLYRAEMPKVRQLHREILAAKRHLRKDRARCLQVLEGESVTPAAREMASTQLAKAEEGLRKYGVVEAALKSLREKMEVRLAA